MFRVFSGLSIELFEQGIVLEHFEKSADDVVNLLSLTSNSAEESSSTLEATMDIDEFLTQARAYNLSLINENTTNFIFHLLFCPILIAFLSGLLTLLLALLFVNFSQLGFFNSILKAIRSCLEGGGVSLSGTLDT